MFMSKLQLLLLYCIVVQSYVIHKDGSTTLETTSADTGIIDQNSNESFQSDQVKEVFFPLGTKDNPLGHVSISSNVFAEKEGLSKLPIEWENTRRDHSFKKITVDDNDSSKETSDKTSQFPLLPKDSLTEEVNTMFPKIGNPGIKRNHIESYFVFHLFGHPVITYHTESNSYIISVIQNGYKWIKIFMCLLRI
ncbi:PREDICTED: uncharacterized protein LOC105622762 [Atta cephalotes]|uniref:Uncharacterized protein n=1 Tax=Atta cephalotes TaxID=12957 RepID=A0A158NPV9_ATTCE|nr:PREDICTED: uncharacterized protein LOC105622762 [Atta cephalotes]